MPIASMSESNSSRPEESADPATPVCTILLLLWAFFVLRGFFYCILFPIWEGYDEYSHFAYIQYVAFNGPRLPAIDTPISKEIAESLKTAPIAWTLDDLAIPHATHDRFWQLAHEERRRRQEALLSIPQQWAREMTSERLTIYEAQQPPLYYWLMSAPYRLLSNRLLPDRVVALRLISVMLASLLVPLAFLTARRFLGSRSAAIAAVALAAAMPELMIDIARVGNESLAIALYALLIWLSLRIVDGAHGRRTILLAGAVAGLGLLTKAYFLTSLPMLAICACMGGGVGEHGMSRKVSSALLAVAAAAGLSVWWYLRTWRFTGTISGLQQAIDLRDMPIRNLLHLVREVQWRQALDSTFVSHIWFGNWSFLQLRYWIYHVFRYVAVAAAVGLLILAWRHITRRRNVRFRGRHIAALSGYCGFFCLGLAYHVLITFASSGSSSSAGWYLYCLVVAEVLLVTAGLYAIMPNRFRRWILPAGTAVFALLDLYAAHFVLIPYYGGLIRHTTGGALATFHVQQLFDSGFLNLAGRLLVNKPAVVSLPLLIVSWVLYFGSTIGLVVLSFRVSIRPFRPNAGNGADGAPALTEEAEGQPGKLQGEPRQS